MEIDNQVGTDGVSDQADQQAVGTEQVASSEPQAIDIDENALIRIKGQDKPIKFGEYGRNFQSQFTKASQEAARLKRELEARDARLAELQREREAYQRSQQASQQGDVYESLRQLPYLDGETAVKVVQGIAGQFKERDQILLGALKQVQQLQTIVQQLHQGSVSQSFEGKIDKWFQDNSWDPAYRDLAKEIYLAYEGEDLDAEFPNIFNSRISAIEKAMEARRQAQLQKARQNRFVPGKGGQVGPSKPIEQRGDESAREIAEKMWEQFQNSGT